MRGLVHEDREAGVDRAHREERGDPHERVLRPRNDHEDPDRHRVEHDRIHDVAQRRNLSELFAEFRLGLASRCNGAFGIGCDEESRFGEHGGSHAGTLR